MSARAITSAAAVLGAAAFAFAACGPSDFDPSTKLQTVRVLATRAETDNAYPVPGANVTLRTLAIDARKDTSREMKIYWLPYLCVNPIGDSYVGCFAPSAVADAGVTAGGEAGAGTGAGVGTGGGGALGGLLQPGTDLTPFLPVGSTYSVVVPGPEIIKTDRAGAPDPYGLLIVFNIACAGRVQVKAADPATGPQQVPLGCFDESGKELGPDDYVIGFTRLFVHAPGDDAVGHASRINHNPVLASVIVNDVPTPVVPDTAILPPAPGSDLPSPIGVILPACHGTCKETTIDIALTPESWEADPDNVGPDGNARHEALWVDFFATAGNVGSEARLLYDTNAGKIDGTSMKYTPTNDPGDAAIYAVVHDNRDGVTWVRIDVHAE